VGSILGFCRLKFRKHCNGSRDIPNREVPKVKRICVGHEGVSEWTVGVLLTWSQTSSTVLEFRGVKSRIHCIRIRDIAKSEVPME
jgi:hypothetical protein